MSMQVPRERFCMHPQARIRTFGTKPQALVEGTSQTPEYSIHTIVDKTNMWQPSEGLDLTVFYLVTVLVLIIVATIIVVAMWYRKKRTS